MNRFKKKYNVITVPAYTDVAVHPRRQEYELWSHGTEIRNAEVFFLETYLNFSQRHDQVTILLLDSRTGRICDADDFGLSRGHPI